MLLRRIDELGWDNILAAPLLSQLVDARIAEGHLDAATAAASALAAMAAQPGRDRIEALAVAADGRIGVAEGREDAPGLLSDAVNRFAALGLRLDAARTRLDLARALATTAPDVAIDTARHARTELEALGARRDADAAAALMRSSTPRAARGRGPWGSSPTASSRFSGSWATG